MNRGETMTIRAGSSYEAVPRWTIHTVHRVEAPDPRPDRGLSTHGSMELEG